MLYLVLGLVLSRLAPPNQSVPKPRENEKRSAGCVDITQDLLPLGSLKAAEQAVTIIDLPAHLPPKGKAPAIRRGSPVLPLGKRFPLLSPKDPDRFSLFRG
jgi:hypothetical protein